MDFRCTRPKGTKCLRASASKIHLHLSAVVLVIYTPSSTSRLLFERRASSRMAALKSGCQVLLNSQVLLYEDFALH